MSGAGMLRGVAFLAAPFCGGLFGVLSSAMPSTTYPDFACPFDSADRVRVVDIATAGSKLISAARRDGPGDGVVLIVDRQKFERLTIRDVNLIATAFDCHLGGGRSVSRLRFSDDATGSVLAERHKVQLQELHAAARKRRDARHRAGVEF